jgi:valyl-tRNA synthetase
LETSNSSTKPTGNESLVEKWVLHKLNLAAAEINTHLTERNFMAATTVAHNFWLYELCDVYIVRLLDPPPPAYILCVE